jgi:hypothetical protein
MVSIACHPIYEIASNLREHESNCAHNVLIPILGTTLKNFKRELADAKGRAAARGRFRVRALDCPGIDRIRGECLITSDRGLYAVSRGQLWQLFAGDTFGVAVAGGELFVSFSTHLHSRVIRTPWRGEVSADAILEYAPVYEVGTQKPTRIHQLGTFKEWLLICQTSTNSLVFIDRKSGEETRQYHPFLDQFGAAIQYDHNHLNSVCACGEVLLICAYRAGTAAMLAVVDGERLRGYQVRHTGAHDVFVSGRDVYYSDTFGAAAEKGATRYGYLIRNNRRVAESFFTRNHGYAVRGICQIGDELLIGHSHKGERRKRFLGHGSLLRFDGLSVTDEIALPFAQVYDIIRFTGEHADPPAVTTWAEVNQLFTEYFGPPVYSRD